MLRTETRYKTRIWQEIRNWRREKTIERSTRWPGTKIIQDIQRPNWFVRLEKTCERAFQGCREQKDQRDKEEINTQNCLLLKEFRLKIKQIFSATATTEVGELVQCVLLMLYIRGFVFSSCSFWIQRVLKNRISSRFRNSLVPTSKAFQLRKRPWITDRQNKTTLKKRKETKEVCCSPRSGKKKARSHPDSYKIWLRSSFSTNSDASWFVFCNILRERNPVFESQYFTKTEEGKRKIDSWQIVYR